MIPLPRLALAVIDAGHYGTEYIFMEDMKERLEKAFAGTEIHLREGEESLYNDCNEIAGAA